MAQSTLHIKIDEYEPESSYDSPSPAPAVQARKPDRACDFCRRRKTRCDGAPTPNSKCSNCRRNQCPCTYQEASRPRGPPKAYVTALEDRMERFEKLLKRLRPEADFTDILGPPLVRGSWKADQSQSQQKESKSGIASLSKGSLSQHSASFSCAALLRPRVAHESGQGSSDDSTTSSDDELGAEDRSRRRLRVRIPSQPPDSPSEDTLSRESYSLDEELSSRFHGKSSFYPLIQATRHFKRESTGSASNMGDRASSSGFPDHRRESYWALQPWEKAWEKRAAGLGAPSASAAHQPRGFPPSDLVLSLLSLYFHYTNVNFPLLHPPTFYTQFRDGLHHQDPKFAAVVWCMMANAARWSDDRRVLWDGWGSLSNGSKMEEDDNHVEWASAGWRFFLRSLDYASFHHASASPPTIFDIQFCSLGAMFLRGTSLHPAAWVIVGAGLRKAMDVGAHRKKVYNTEPNVEDELWKRAFWLLVIFDRYGSASLGRPCCAREEDFDLDFPLEVDDEYWTSSDGTKATFQQPPGRPSRVSALVCLAKLTQIMAYAIRTIYCIDKSKVLLGLVSDNWQEQIVSQLNTALDEWVDAIPEHLKWSPDMKDDVFSSQSSLVYTTYYLTLILIYRPFTTAQTILPDNDVPRKTRKPFPFPADSICANAAHSAIAILDTQVRKGSFYIPNMISVAQMCSAVQLMNYFVHTALRKDHDPGSSFFATEKRAQERALEDVDKCIRCLEIAESRWIMARKFLVRICESLPDPSQGPGRRRVSVQGYAATPGHGVSMPSPFSSEGTNFASLQPRLTPPESSSRAALDPAQALMSEGNWRWFQGNAAFQERMGKRQTPDTLRHHVPVPVPLHQTPPPLMTIGAPRGYPDSMPATRDTSPYPVHPGEDRIQQYPDIPRRASRSSTVTLSNAASFVPEQPISSVRRVGRASHSGQYLNVSTPQSAAREEPAAWSQRPMDVPKPPYEAVQQAAFGQQRERRSQHYAQQKHR